MNERYPIPVKDLKTGAKVTGKVAGGIFEGIKPIAKLESQKQAQRILRLLLSRNKTF